MGYQTKCFRRPSAGCLFPPFREAASDYGKMKIALIKRYDLTEDGYRREFRVSTPETDES